MTLTRLVDDLQSPLVRSARLTVFSEYGALPFHPDGCWDFVFFRRDGKTLTLRTGLTTTTVQHAYRAGDEMLSITFAPHAFMDLMPAEIMVNEGKALEGASPDRFCLGTDVIEIPSLETVDDFVRSLTARGLIEGNDLVAGLVQGQPRAATERTQQRHFLRTTGLTYKHFTMVERARKAAALLAMGQQAGDVAFALGYADQAHLIRSVKLVMGRTPGQIAQSGIPGI